MITIADIERGIENATAQTRHYCDRPVAYLSEIIIPLTELLEKGVCDGISCDEQSIHFRMDALEAEIERVILT